MTIITNQILKLRHLNYTKGLKQKSKLLPPVKFDLMSINDKLSNFISAGFYYKTFMWPTSFWEKIYEL